MEVGVGRRDHAHIDTAAPAVAPTGVIWPYFEDAEQLGLKGGLHIADSSRKGVPPSASSK
jgi:hypothetical protein